MSFCTTIFRLGSWLCLVGVLTLLVFNAPGLTTEDAQQEKSRSGPLTPAQEQATFRLAPGLRIELVASEPQIESPVAIAFDENGKLWVVEMGDYPNGPGKGQPPAGRIRQLEDRDGDGRYEHSSIFAEQLLFANGLLPWRGGLLVTAAPYITHLSDTNGDGRADKRDILFEGFAVENPQLRVSHPNLGLDNWIYVANGLRGGQVVRSGKNQKPINLSGRDFRFDLIKDRYEAISGMGQFGNTFDDWGHRFVCDNRHHLRQVVLEDRYLKRNPFLAATQVVADISELEDGLAGSGGKVYPLSKNWTTSNLHAGRFTAACGVYIYRGNLLPEEYRGCAYTCDPTGNLVHREVLQPHGATFQSHPGRKGVEFLATPDDWSRPVFLTEGPDGALYLVDMYRAVIEHPQFMPPELKNRPDLLLGKERGRIWRIVPENYQHKSVRPQLGKATTAELVALLEHPGTWWRTTAQRLLLERQDRTAVPALQKLVQSSQEPRARILAAWLLEALGALPEPTVQKLLQDAHPEVRTQAVLLAESRLAKSPALQQAVLARATDAAAHVRFQTALSLGEWSDDRILPALAKIALAGVDDSWTRSAVASAVPEKAGKLLAQLLQDGLTAARTPGRLALLEELTTQIGARKDRTEAAAVLDALLKAGQHRESDNTYWFLAGVDGLAQGMARRGIRLGDFLQALPAEKHPGVARTQQLLTRAAQIALDEKRPQPERLLAIRLLSHAAWKNAAPALPLLSSSNQQVRLAAVQALSSHDRPEVADYLLKLWRTATPSLRREVTEALLRRPKSTLALLQAIQAGQIKPGDIDPLRTRQLLQHRDTALRTLAAKLLRNNLPADRQKVLAQYQPALHGGDAKRGQEIFRKNCATCHRVANIGVDVGPNISDSRTRTEAALLTDILNPNLAIDNNYVNYTITTSKGQVLTGIIAGETSASITLKRAENQTDTVLRPDIDEIISSGVSLMPEGLEKNITVPEMADLLSFLKNWRYLDGAVPTGTP